MKTKRNKPVKTLAALSLTASLTTRADCLHINYADSASAHVEVSPILNTKSVSSMTHSIRIRPQRVWDENADKRLDELAVKRAFDEATPEEIEELNELLILRDDAQNKISPDEILKRRNDEIKIKNLLKAFDECVSIR